MDTTTDRITVLKAAITKITDEITSLITQDTLEHIDALLELRQRAIDELLVLAPQTDDHEALKAFINELLNSNKLLMQHLRDARDGIKRSLSNSNQIKQYLNA